MIRTSDSKSGAALVIALGFLAVLTVMIIAFSALTRSERLAARTYLNSAQTRHLLHTALSRAMLDIDAAASTNYPDFYALGSIGDGADLLADTLDFELSETYFQNNTNGLWAAYLSERNTAEWETVTVQDGTDTEAVGRIGYVVINSSGFLDANAVGGAAGRGRGLSPSEIRLSTDLLPEFEAGGVRIDSTGSKSAATNSADAFAYNRSNTWHRFETLRDVWQLNNYSRGNMISSRTESFSTFSWSLSTNDYGRSFMGTNSVTVSNHLDTVREQLEAVSGIESEFVLRQLFDYLDTDTVPQDLDNEYSDYSVEPVPMINELAMTLTSVFYPQIETIEGDDGGTTSTVTSVIITNSCELSAEVWYPFVGYTNEQTFTFSIADTPIESGSIDASLIPSVSDWADEEDIPADECHPDNREAPYELTISSSTAGAQVTSSSALIDLFETLGSTIEFPSITVTDEAGNKVDQVLNLELPMVTAATNSLIQEIELLSSNLFSGATVLVSSNTFTVSVACIDPRLNWDGSSDEQWQEHYGIGAGIDSIGDLNATELELIDTDDPQTMIYVRNMDRIDSPWEFTYMLPNSTRPWKTIQMLEAYDAENTRAILEKLSPFPDGPPRTGRVSPYSPHTNIIASAFLNMPINEFMGRGELTRLNEEDALKAAALFMDQVDSSGWSDDASQASYGISITDLVSLMNGETNPWILESFYRNSRELFNSDDTLYTILLAAQGGTDADGDGLISSTEVRSTEQAVVYVWRDRTTGRAATVFFGLTDTLQSSIADGQTWGDILQAFEP